MQNSQKVVFAKQQVVKTRKNAASSGPFRTSSGVSTWLHQDRSRPPQASSGPPRTSSKVFTWLHQDRPGLPPEYSRGFIRTVQDLFRSVHVASSRPPRTSSGAPTRTTTGPLQELPRGPLRTSQKQSQPPRTSQEQSQPSRTTPRQSIPSRTNPRRSTPSMTSSRPPAWISHVISSEHSKRISYQAYKAFFQELLKRNYVTR